LDLKIINSVNECFVQGGEAEISQVSEGISTGVDNYVVKPFTPTSFGEKLGAVYNKRFGKK
jgi:response regulator of citrate/malate metabolism